MKNENVIQKKTYNFSLDILKLYKILVKQKEFVLSRQLLRCGTSIGANVEEALAGQSRKDFISKMSIASKEARETKYWLRLLQDSQIVNSNFTIYIDNINEIINILTVIVKTSQSK